MVKKKTPGSGRRERYIQASILLGLYSGPSYGYELINSIQTFGFIEGSAPPGMIYRHLRQMEEEGLVRSEWETREVGAAKRIYTLTPDGKDALHLWIRFMSGQAKKLERFVEMFHKIDSSSLKP